MVLLGVILVLLAAAAGVVLIAGTAQLTDSVRDRRARRHAEHPAADPPHHRHGRHLGVLARLGAAARRPAPQQAPPGRGQGGRGRRARPSGSRSRSGCRTSSPPASRRSPRSAVAARRPRRWWPTSPPSATTPATSAGGTTRSAGGTSRTTRPGPPEQALTRPAVTAALSPGRRLRLRRRPAGRRTAAHRAVTAAHVDDAGPGPRGHHGREPRPSPRWPAGDRRTTVTTTEPSGRCAQPVRTAPLAAATGDPAAQSTPPPRVGGPAAASAARSAAARARWTSRTAPATTSTPVSTSTTVAASAPTVSTVALPRSRPPRRLTGPPSSRACAEAVGGRHHPERSQRSGNGAGDDDGHPGAGGRQRDLGTVRCRGPHLAPAPRPRARRGRAAGRRAVRRRRTAPGPARGRPPRAPPRAPGPGWGAPPPARPWRPPARRDAAALTTRCRARS